MEQAVLNALCCKALRMERERGFEPRPSAWEAESTGHACSP